MCAKLTKFIESRDSIRIFILPPPAPFLRRSFVLISFVCILFEFAFAIRSSSVLGGTELLLDRDEAVVFKDAKTPEYLFKFKQTLTPQLSTILKQIWAA